MLTFVWHNTSVCRKKCRLARTFYYDMKFSTVEVKLQADIFKRLVNEEFGRNSEILHYEKILEQITDFCEFEYRSFQFWKNVYLKRTCGHFALKWKCKHHIIAKFMIQIAEKKKSPENSSTLLPVSTTTLAAAPLSTGRSVGDILPPSHSFYISSWRAPKS